MTAQATTPQAVTGCLRKAGLTFSSRNGVEVRGPSKWSKDRTVIVNAYAFLGRDRSEAAYADRRARRMEILTKALEALQGAGFDANLGSEGFGVGASTVVKVAGKIGV